MEKESTTNVPSKALLPVGKSPLACGLRSLPLLFMLSSSSFENRPRSIYLPASFPPIYVFSHKPLPTPTVHHLASVSSSPTTMGELLTSATRPCMEPLGRCPPPSLKMLLDSLTKASKTIIINK